MVDGGCPTPAAGTGRRACGGRRAVGSASRMNDLAEKNREGLLTEEERNELESYVRVGDLLALLHLKARRAMERRPRTGS
jgi:hypothetical protein